MLKVLLLIMLANQQYKVDTTTYFCKKENVLKVQVLGSGGPELTKDRASSSYLVWQNNKAIFLIDAGGGSALRYGQSNAKWEDLRAVFFTHFHADHTSDFPALVKASWFGDRTIDLPVFGPYENRVMPSTTGFFHALFNSKNGAYKYLSDMVENQQNSAYKIIPRNISAENNTRKLLMKNGLTLDKLKKDATKTFSKQGDITTKTLMDSKKRKDKEKTNSKRSNLIIDTLKQDPATMIFKQNGLTIKALNVKHGSIPALAYIIQFCDQTVVFSGDTTGEGFEGLELENTDLFIAHNAIPEKFSKSLHMPPSRIGEIAKQINTKKLILSHRMNRTLGKEKETLEYINKSYQGEIEFANDLDIFTLDK